MNIQEISLDLTKSDFAMNCIYVGQGDQGGTTIKAFIYDNGTEVDLSDYDCSLLVRLPDKRKYYRSAATIVGNVATITLDESRLCCVPGYTDEAYFIFESDGVVYSTERFALQILRSARDGVIPEQSWDDSVDKLINFGNEAIRKTEEAISNTETAIMNASTAIDSANTALEAANQAIETITADENDRLENELSRIDAEDKREEAERIRQEHESERITAEDSRVLAEAKRAADFAEMQDRSKGWLYYECQEGEYDDLSRLPDIEHPAVGVIYCVPSLDPQEGDRWDEYRWDSENGVWERMGGGQGASITPLSTEQIEAIVRGEGVTSGNVLTGSGASYLQELNKSVYAEKSHTHVHQDILSVSGSVINDKTISLNKLNDNLQNRLTKIETDIKDNADSWDSLSQQFVSYVDRVSFWHNMPQDELVMYFDLADGTHRRVLFKVGGGVTITSE